MRSPNFLVRKHTRRKGKGRYLRVAWTATAKTARKIRDLLSAAEPTKTYDAISLSTGERL